jgi:phospholipase C
MADARNVSRRRFLEQLALAGGGLALAGPASLSARKGLPKPTHSGIDHVVLVMMENRSFDHMLGWLPGADGRQSGLVYSDAAGVPHATHALAPDYQGCGHPDPDHSYRGGRIEYNSGACDGWLRAGANDEYAIGYYVQNDLPFYSAAATGWTACDRYFSAIMGPTFPNRFYQHAAQTDRLQNTFELSTLPTIWDRLAAAGLTGRYYFNDAPFLGLWGPKYFPISRSFNSFLDDCAAGTLPHVSYVDPKFIQELTGTTNDDHPHADIRNGQAYLNQVYDAVTQSPAWKRTLLVINYDEWGGFFDHVAPAAASIPPASQAAGDTDGLRGFRVPCLLISPYASRGLVTHTVFDHTSVLRFIEWRWGLQPLTERDETANNLALALDFGNPNQEAPTYLVPPGPFGSPCPFSPSSLSPSSSEANEWSAVRALAQSYGWTF